MLRTDSMPRAHYAALEQAERGFYGVRVNVGSNIDTELMLNPLVLALHAEMASGSFVHGEIVSHQDFDIVRDILTDILFKGPGAYILRMKEAQFPLPLPDANNDL